MKALTWITAACLLLVGCRESPAAVRAGAATSAAQADRLLKPTGWVTDAADVLPPADEAALETKLTRFSNHTKHQLAVVTVSSLEGQTVDAFTLNLAKRWGVGRKGYNDGVMLLVAPNERRVRIEVGYGLENPLSDELCQKILADDVLPRFRQGQYPQGIDAGVAAIIAVLDRQAGAKTKE